MEKPFRTAEEQVDILESRGLKITDREDAVRTLLSWSYYTLVNGYKDMFLDPTKSREAHDDRYIEGAYFEQLKLAYALDRGLRSATIDVLMKAESVMKTSLVHAFCQKYRQPRVAPPEEVTHYSNGQVCSVHETRGHTYAEDEACR